MTGKPPYIRKDDDRTARLYAARGRILEWLDEENALEWTGDDASFVSDLYLLLDAFHEYADRSGYCVKSWAQAVAERDRLQAIIDSQEFRKECADTPFMRDVMAERDRYRDALQEVCDVGDRAAVQAARAALAVSTPGLKERVAEARAALSEGDEAVVAYLTGQNYCEACGHLWSRHTSGGMCAGEVHGPECYCVLFPPDGVAVSTP